MLGKTRALGKWKTTNRWQAACNESNARFTNKLCRSEGQRERQSGLPRPFEAFNRKDREEEPRRTQSETQYFADHGST
jgi:hypothetical protein